MNRPDDAVPLAVATRAWLRIGLLSFGGPAGQIATMHRILVEERRWISEERFLHALSFCMVLPGPEAQQLAIYVGWLLNGIPGGVVAGSLFVLPGFVVMLGLGLLYAAWGTLPVVDGLFFGLKAAVLAIVVQALVRIARRALKGPFRVGLAIAAFVALFVLGAPFPAIVLLAALAGWAGGKLGLDRAPDASSPSSAPEALADVALDRGAARLQPSAGRTAIVAATCALAWVAPVALAWALLPEGHVLVEEGVFFGKAAVVTFGGAYAVLAYVAQEAVHAHHWLTPGEMLDGLGLAETTPGPLILVLQFVGTLAAFRKPLPFTPLAAGVLGAAMTAWVTFVPCFLWVLAGAPWVERLRGRKGLDAALAGVTAAVCGVIADLACWFGLHVLFRRVAESHEHGLDVLVPDVTTLDVPATVLALAAGVALLRFKAPMPAVLAGSALAGLAWRLLAGGPP